MKTPLYIMRVRLLYVTISYCDDTLSARARSTCVWTRYKTRLYYV